jgi:hypothetical protein
MNPIPAGVRMLRRYIGVAALVALTGCSSTFFEGLQSPAGSDQEPANYQSLVAKDLAALKSPVGGYEISSVRKTRLAQPGDWVVCVKTTGEERPTFFAVFLRDGRVIERRLAVVVDECAQEQFLPLPPDVKSSPSK